MSRQTARTTYGAGLTTSERRQWNRQTDALLARRSADCQRSIAARRQAEAATVARLTASHPGASWHYVNHPTVGRVLVSVPND
jgi:hypothetical protein